RRYAIDNHDQRGAVRLTRRQEPKHQPVILPRVGAALAVRAAVRGATTGGPWSGIDPRWLWDGIDACGPGPVLVALPRRTHAGSGVDGVAAAARAHGFQVIDAATGPATDAPRRHVALVVRRGRDRARAADWLKALARASPRLHLVFVPVPARTQWGCVDAPGQSSRGRADDCR